MPFYFDCHPDEGDDLGKGPPARYPKLAGFINEGVYYPHLLKRTYRANSNHYLQDNTSATYLRYMHT